MGLDEIKRVLRDYKSVLKDKYHVNTIGIFGSYVRNEQAGDSDLDIPVDFAAPISLSKFIDMEVDWSLSSGFLIVSERPNKLGH